MQKYVFLAICVISFYPAAYLTGQGFKDSDWKPIDVTGLEISGDSSTVIGGTFAGLDRPVNPTQGVPRTKNSPRVTVTPCLFPDKDYTDKAGNVFKGNCENYAHTGH